MLFCCMSVVDCGAALPRYIVFTLTFDSSPIKGEGDSVGCVVLLLTRAAPSGLRIKSAMTGWSYPAGTQRVVSPRPVD